MRVLVIDDDPDFRAAVSEILVEHGHDVVVAPDARTALDAVREGTPDTVLMDVILSDAPRFELLRQLRALPGGSSLRIVGMSGFAAVLAEARREQVDFDAFLEKPFDTDELLRVLRPPGG